MQRLDGGPVLGRKGRIRQGLPTNLPGGVGLPLLAEKPILMCWGEQDFCFHLGFLARLREIYPKAAVHTYPNASHYLLEDAGEEIIPVIEQFLQQPVSK